MMLLISIFTQLLKVKKITVEVPLEFHGEAPVEDEGGQVIKVVHELEVECDPQNLPSEIVVDLAALQQIGDSIHVSDLNLPEGVEPTLNPEDTIATASEAKEIEEEEEENAEEIDFSEIAVEKKGKEDDGESEEGDEGRKC